MKNKTEFIRVEKTNNFSIIHNGFLRRKDLSWKSKGILAYILSLPDDWNINLNEVMRHATEGESAFRSGWKELQNAGYVSRKPIRDGQRITHWETVVKENVDVTQSPVLGGFLDVDNLDVDNLDVDNRNLLSTYSTKDLTKQSTDNTKGKYIKQDFDELWKKYPNKQGKQQALKSYEKAIKEGVAKEDISSGIDRFLEYCKFNNWYTPAYGSTWFNQKRWEDDYEIGAKVLNATFAEEAPIDPNEVEVPEGNAELWEQYLKEQEASK